MTNPRSTVQRVKEALERSPSVSKRLIEVRERGTVVELHGRVHSFREKLDAQRIAEQESPDGVSNRLDVDYEDPGSESKVVRNTRAALRGAGDVDAHTVTVAAHGRKVLLRGTVATPKSRRAAADVAVGVPGVKEVVNLVRVDDREHRVDRHAADSILDRLYRHRRLRNHRLDVAVAGGTAVLSGQVRSRRQRRLAEQIASEFPVLRIRNRIRLAS